MKISKFNLVILISAILLSIGVNAQIDRSEMPVPGPEPKINLEKPKEFELKNGIKVLVVENNKLPRVSYQLSIDNKPYVAGDKAGVGSMLSSMLGNGTTSISKDDFNEEVDYLGASMNFGSSGGFASGLVKYSDRIVELMADAAINPLFTEEEFAKQKDKYLESLKADEKSLDAISSRVVDALGYGKDHAYGEFVTEETVNNVTFQDVKDLYNKRYAPNNAYIVVVGDVKARKVKKQLKKYFGKWEKQDLPEMDPPALTDNVSATEINFVDLPTASQSNITVTNNVSLKQNDPDYFAALMADNILGGGGEGYLFKNLREDKGYTYGAYSSLSANRYGVSRFRANAKVRNAVTDSAVVEFINEIKRIRTEPVDEKTLENAKAKYVGNFVMALERPQTIANYALNIKRNNLPEDFYTNYLENINNVTIEDVKRVSNKYFKIDNARIVIVGKASEVLPNLDRLELPIKYFDKYATPTDKPEINKPIPEGVTVETIFNDYIKAIGGEEKVETIDNAVMKGKMSAMGQSLDVEMVMSQNNRSFMQISMPGMTIMKTAFDGEKGYQEMQGQRREMAEEEVKNAQMTEYLFPELMDGSNFELVGIESTEDGDAYVIQITENEKSYYSTETGLKIKEVTSIEQMGQTMESTVNYADYKEVDGILMPHKLTQQMGPQNFEISINEIMVNQDIPADKFQ
jgi:predicted Zn-dependent peptidase